MSIWGESSGGWDRATQDSSVDLGSVSGWNDHNSMMSIPYDRASSQVVQRLFDDIDVLLFEQETSDSLSKALQTECLDWSSRFLHLRAIGVQLAPEINEVAEVQPLSADTSLHSDDGSEAGPAPPDDCRIGDKAVGTPDVVSPDELFLVGCSTRLQKLPANTVPTAQEISAVLTSEAVGPVPSGIFWETYEENLASDGIVEEFFAFDSGDGALTAAQHSAGASVAPAERAAAAQAEAHAAISNQVFDDLWERAVPALLPAVERLLEHLRSDARSISSGDSAEDLSSQRQGQRPLSQGMLEYLSREHDDDDEMFRANRVTSAVVSGRTSVVRKGPRRLTEADPPADVNKLRGLTNAMTIRGLPLQNRKSSLALGPTLHNYAQPDQLQPDWSRSGVTGARDFEVDDGGRGRRQGSARLGSARLGSARFGSARLGSARLGSARLRSSQPQNRLAGVGDALSMQRISLPSDKKYATLISQVFDGPDLNLVDPRWPHREPRVQNLGGEVLPPIRAGVFLPGSVENAFGSRPGSGALPALPSLSRRRVLSANINGRGGPQRHIHELASRNILSRDEYQLSRPNTMYDTVGAGSSYGRSQRIYP